MKKIILLMSLVLSLYAYSDKDIKVKVNGELLNSGDISTALSKLNIPQDYFFNVKNETTTKRRKEFQFKILQKIIDEKLLKQSKKESAKKATVEYIKFFNFDKLLVFSIKTKPKRYESSLDISLALEVDNSLNKKDIDTKLKDAVYNSINMYDKSYFYSKTNTNQTLNLMLGHDIKQSIVKKNKKIKHIYISSITITNPLSSKAPTIKELYNKKCASCHGRKGLQKALGVSGKIANMNQFYIYKTLKGYKKHDLNKYGRASYMWRYVDNLNDKNLKDLSAYIDSL